MPTRLKTARQRTVGFSLRSGRFCSAPKEFHPPTHLAEEASDGYIVFVNRLTKQEQLVLGIVLGLLLTGWAVQWYRTAHPAAPAAAAIQTAKP